MDVCVCVGAFTCVCIYVHDNYLLMKTRGRHQMFTFIAICLIPLHLEPGLS